MFTGLGISWVAQFSPRQMNWLRHPEVPWPGEAYSSHTVQILLDRGLLLSSVTLQAKGAQWLISLMTLILNVHLYTWVLSVYWHISSLGGDPVMSPAAAQYLAHSFWHAAESKQMCAELTSAEGAGASLCRQFPPRMKSVCISPQ